MKIINKYSITALFFLFVSVITKAQIEVLSNGKVGVATSSPTEFLDVVGNINIGTSNAFKINGNKILWHNNITTDIFIGIGAGTSTTGANNCLFGYNAGYTNSTGYNNTAVGSQALYSNTTGYHNSATGASALYSNTTGFANTATGLTALYANTGNQNTATGMQALRFNTSGALNTATGYQAAYSNTTGSYNTASGYGALNDNTTGSYNTAFGTGTGNLGGSNTTGSNNTFVGYNATVSTAGISNITALGNGATTSASNMVRVGNSAVTSIGGYANWTNISDGRFKTNVQENVKGLEFIKKLRPVTYQMNTNAIDDFVIQNMPDSVKTAHQQGMDFAGSSAMVHSGFIAQEVEQAAQDAVFNSSIVHHPANDTDPYSLAYAEIVVPLVKAVQELSKTVDSLQTAMATCCQQTKSMHLNNSQSNNSKDVELSNKNIVVLDQNVPNPFAEQTVISYFLPDNVSHAQIIFLGQSGKLIKVVDLTEKGKGQINVFANDLSNGTYTYSLIVDGKTVETKKMVKQ